MNVWRVLIFALALVTAAHPQMITISHPTPADPRQFPVFAWGGSSSDPELLRGMREAGFTVSGFCRPEDLDKVQAAGLGCFVMDKRISLTRDQWEKLPPEDQLRKGIVELVREVGNHPAALGFRLLDEPNVSMMQNLGRVAAILREVAPDKWPYVNLFPRHASQRRFAPIGYEAYVRMLVEVIRQPFISYDLYALLNGEMMDRFYTNLEIIRRISLETKTPFWNCVLSNAHFSYMEPSDATLHLQAYSTMAYGGRGVQWFTYLTPDRTNFRLAAVDQFGNRTPTWHMLQRINNEIHALAPTLLQLHSTGVYHYPDVPEQGHLLAESRLVKHVELSQAFVKPLVVGRILIGEFEDGRGRPYLMLVNKNLKYSFLFDLELKEGRRKLMRISPYSGKEEPLGDHPNERWLAPGAGMLLRVE